jgi:NADH dehydrogenase
MNNKNHVVIIGAGFAGLNALKILARKGVRVTVIDRNNYHTFFPLLYQVAAAEIEPSRIAYPLRQVTGKYRNAEYLMGEVEGVNLDRKKVILKDRNEIDYDFLVVAAGSDTNFFDTPGAKEHSFTLKSLDDGILLRNHILTCFEKAEMTKDRERRKKLLSFVVAGGGATGIEFTSSLAEFIQGPFNRDYSELQPDEVEITIVEGMDRLLPFMPEDLSRYTREKLEKKGVHVRTGVLVKEVSGGRALLSDNTSLPAETVVWTAGVRGREMKLGNSVSPGKKGLYPVRSTLQVEGHPGVYVAGDLADFRVDGEPVPMMAPAAMQQGKSAAGNILRQIRGKEPVEASHKPGGAMVTLGRNRAVVTYKGMKMRGFPAWIMWVLVHILYLAGFRNRIILAINWLWNYLTFSRVNRLIMGEAARW